MDLLKIPIKAMNSLDLTWVKLMKLLYFQNIFLFRKSLA